MNKKDKIPKPHTRYFGEKIRAFRHKQGLNLTDLANLLKIGVSEVSRIECGKKKPPKFDIETGEKLKDLLKLEFSEYCRLVALWHVSRGEIIKLDDIEKRLLVNFFTEILKNKLKTLDNKQEIE